jgi:hypothetical protein
MLVRVPLVPTEVWDYLDKVAIKISVPEDSAQSLLSALVPGAFDETPPVGTYSGRGAPLVPSASAPVISPRPPAAASPAPELAAPVAGPLGRVTPPNPALPANTKLQTSPMLGTQTAVPKFGYHESGGQAVPSSIPRTIGGILGTIGGYGLGAVMPGVAAQIPSTPLGKIVAGNRELKQAGEKEKQELEKAKTQEELSSSELTPVQIPGQDEPVMVPRKDAARLTGVIASAQTRADASRDVADTRAQGQLTAEQEREQFMKDMADKKEAMNPYEQWLANPQVYDAYLKSQQEAKGQQHGGMMSPYAAVRLVDYAYRFDPRLLPFAQEAMQTLSKQLGMPLPAGVDISTPPAGQPRDESGTPIGLAQPGAPTGATRTAGQFADKALLAIPRIRPEIADLSKNLGPISGRAAHFLVGDIGSSGDPQFDQKYSALRTDITFLTSNAARFHLNSVRAVEEFLKLADAGKASAASLNGFIDSMEGWAKDAKKVGEGNQPSGEPPKGAKVRTYNPQTGKLE